VGTLLGAPLALLTLLRRDDERLRPRLHRRRHVGGRLHQLDTSGVVGWGFWQVGLGILGGVALIRLLDLFTPHTSCAVTRGLRSWRIR